MTYDPLFESVPAVTTTLHTASAGDQVVLANQTAMGFDIQVLNGRDRVIELFAAAATGNWALIATAAPDLDTPVVTGLMTVEGVKVASGLVSGQLTVAALSGGVFVTSGNVTCPNEAGFSVTLNIEVMGARLNDTLTWDSDVFQPCAAHLVFGGVTSYNPL